MNPEVLSHVHAAAHISPKSRLLIRLATAILVALFILSIPVARAQDTVLPTVKIKSPKRSATGPGGSTMIAVSGTAKDDVGVVRVLVEVPGGFSGDATITGADPHAVEWSIMVPVQSGTNTVQATAFDAQPNSSRLRTLKFNFSKLCTLTTAAGSGGSVSLRSGSKRVGKTLHVSARPAAGFLFEQWSLDGTMIAATRTLDFVVPDVAMAALSASFVTNPYVALSGAYNDILRAGGNASGYYTLRLNPNGSFTVSAKGTGFSLGKKGFIELDGTAHFSIARHGKLPLTLDLKADTALGGVTVSVRDEQTTVQYAASSVRFATPASLPAVSTMVFQPGSGLPAAIAGSGYATLRRGATGSLRLLGTLADGTLLSFAAFPMDSSGAVFPIFKRFTNGAQFDGAVRFTGTIPDTKLDGVLHWSAPAQPRRGFLAFDGIVNTRGAAYIQPPQGQLIAPLGPGGAAAISVAPALPLTSLTFDLSNLATFDRGPAPTGGTANIFVPHATAIRGTTVIATIQLPSQPPLPPTSVLPTSVTLAGFISGSNISHPTVNTVICTWVIPAGAPLGFQDVVVTFNVFQTYRLTRSVNLVDPPRLIGRVLLYPSYGLFSCSFPDDISKSVRVAKGAIVQDVQSGVPDFGLCEGFSLHGNTSDAAKLYLYTTP